MTKTTPSNCILKSNRRVGDSTLLQEAHIPWICSQTMIQHSTDSLLQDDPNKLMEFGVVGSRWNVEFVLSQMAGEGGWKVQDEGWRHQG